MRRKGVANLLPVAIGAIILIVGVVIGFYIVAQVESAMNISGSSWYSAYQNFVNSVQTSFTLLGIAPLVVVAVFLIGLLYSLVSGGRTQT